MRNFGLRKLLYAIREAAVLTVNHDGIEHAGYLAFLGLLALFPFLVFLVAVIGVIGQGSAGAEFINSVLYTLPAHVSGALAPRIQEIISGPPQGLLTISILGTIWTASSAVEGIRTVLNRAYHVSAPPPYQIRRLLSIVQLLIFTFTLIIGMLLLVFTPVVIEHVESWLGIDLIAGNGETIRSQIFTMTPAILFVAIAYIYYVLPNIKQQLISVVPGAAIVVAAWIGTAHLFTLYLLNFEQVNLIYGSLGGLIAALFFFYVCNIIFIFGAELNHQIVRVLGQHYEKKI
jgi:membrane protein